MFGSFLDLCMSPLRKGHANFLCIVPILSIYEKYEFTRTFISYKGSSATSCARTPLQPKETTIDKFQIILLDSNVAHSLVKFKNHVQIKIRVK